MLEENKKGYYKEVEKTIHHEAVPGVEEKYHYEEVKAYTDARGKIIGKDVKKVIDVAGVPAKEAWDEVVKERVWVPYSQKELDQIRINELKQALRDSDYKAIKYAEGLITPEAYAPIRAQREAYRAEINALESKIY